MTFRIEEKFFANYNSLDKLFCWIKYRNAIEIYPKRYISSLYFDSENKQSLLDSEEGIVPRKKIRLRSYQKLLDFKKKTYYEMKINSVEGKYKINKAINKSDIKRFLSNGIFDPFYGICKPTIYVTYLRYYFAIEKIRLTIDINISYNAYQKNKKNNFIIYDDDIVVEIKSQINSDLENISRMFPFAKRRFSKYARGMLYLYNQYKNIINS